MIELKELTCEACRVGAPQATPDEIADFMPQIPEWEILVVDEEKRLRRTYNFKNFSKALSFTNQVGEIAEAAGHHPVIITEWGQVTVSWWTHKIKGLHLNDFVMAAKTDRLI
ncbi:MAG: 4a-hydroxytetrahydrobiopterin dehydratase [Thermodesulfobacteriota bacterium]